MSTADRRFHLSLGGRNVEVGHLRVLALAATATLLFAFVSVFYYIIDVVGDPSTLTLVVAVTMLAATLAARKLPVSVAAVLGLLLFGAGLWYYVTALPPAVQAGLQGRVAEDVLALFTGLSILRITNVQLWVLAFAPAPVFSVWYFALRRRYALAATVGTAVVAFFILTGDITLPVAMLGVLGAAGAVGFGELDRWGGRLADAEVVAVALALMVALPMVISFVPGGAGLSFAPGGGPGSGATVEANLLNTGSEVSILGSIDLSPKVRYTVTASTSSYWRVGSFDRYTGDSWVRSGSTEPYDGRLGVPPGPSRQVTQRFEVETETSSMAAAWRPVSVSGDGVDDLRVTRFDGLAFQGTLSAGDSYVVESRVLAASPDQLRRAGTDYPDDIEEAFTDNPQSTPERLGEFTDRITANAQNPYDTARVIEDYLESEKNYSLDVDRPNGNIASSFLFDMDAGYCTYFATTMAAMLRSQDIPTRFVVGYTPGQRVDENRWVVRGYNSHAWVEAYFPDYGWVRFDPTPAGPRTAAQRSRLQEAREANLEDIDTGDTEDGQQWTPDDTPTPNTPANPGGTDTPTNSTPAGVPGGVNATTVEPGAPGEQDGGLPVPELPSREVLALWGIILAGGAAAVHRSGAHERAYRTIWLRWQPREDPGADVERAFERLTYLFGQTERERRPGETARQYLAAVTDDERARQVGRLYEQARYAGGVDEAGADEAVSLVDELVAEEGRLPGSL
jgi:transglutaminase-like putative cysteine protease